MPDTLIHGSAQFEDTPLRGALTNAEKERTDVLQINEIFHSIQGESSRAGEPCIFVRLTGCGLRCSYCDTEYAFYEGEDQSIENVMALVGSFGTRLVELTGGEPLEQQGIYTLIHRLLDAGYEVMIETGGHVDIGRVDRRVKRIVDLKTPSSGMMHRNRYQNLEHITRHDEIKFVLGDRQDYEWSREQIERFSLDSKAGTLLLSPVHGAMDLAELSRWILEDRLPVKLQMQLHKLIWPHSMRGV